MKLAWQDLQLFLAVAEGGSLSAAGRSLQLGQPTLSRRMSELEEQMGEVLFIRTPHGVELTRVGKQLLAPAQRMAEWATEAERSVQRDERKPEGTVRVAAPPGVAIDFLAPLAVEVAKKYPQIQLELLSSVELVSLSRGEADLALRTKASEEPDIINLDHLRVPMRVYASADYQRRLKQKLKRQKPRLQDLDWICWAPPYEQMTVNQELRRMIADFKPVLSSDDFNVQFAACRAGAGVMVLAKAPHRFSSLRQMKELPIDLGPKAEGDLYLLCHKRLVELPKIKAVVNLIAQEFADVRKVLQKELDRK